LGFLQKRTLPKKTLQKKSYRKVPKKNVHIYKGQPPQKTKRILYPAIHQRERELLYGQLFLLAQNQKAPLWGCFK
jgi:hypothetical protein